MKSFSQSVLSLKFADSVQTNRRICILKICFFHLSRLPSINFLLFYLKPCLIYILQYASTLQQASNVLVYLKEA